VLTSNPGPLSPLHAYNMEFVQAIIQMARMRESLSPLEKLHLINNMIAGTQAQTDLITLTLLRCTSIFMMIWLMQMLWLN